MSDSSSQAVFLSYASQDVEAARRICGALREAGVEVWFDQSELRGGDKWDQNIRRQIRECALFAPVISANTQARGEGYFRLEWKLAADRSHLMARDQMFFLPIVVDDTPCQMARVPDEFHAVQWTHLPGGETSPGFCERVKRILEDLGAGTVPPLNLGTRPPIPAPGPGTAAPGREELADRRRPAGWQLAFAFAGVAAGVAMLAWQPWRRGEPGTLRAPAESASETKRLVAKARELFQVKDDAQRENFFLAEDLLKRAVALDVSDGEAWAASGHLSADLYRFGFDRTPARLEAMRKQTEYAIRLAPESVAVLVTQATAADYLGLDPAKTEPVLRDLARRLPDNWEVLYALGRKLGRAGRLEEAMPLLERATALSGGNPAPMNDGVSYLLAAGRYADAEAVVAKSLVRAPSGRALNWDLILKLCWRGDLEAAAAALDQWPPWSFIEDRGASLAGLVRLWRREPDKALAIYEKIPRDYVRDISFTGPRAALTALAHAMAGNREAALADWELTMQAADRELAVAPGDGHALYWKAWALAERGERRAADEIRQQLKQRKWEPPSYYSPEAKFAGLALTLGEPEQALATLEAEVKAREAVGGVFKNSYVSFGITRAVLERNPLFDRLRADARFKAVVAAAPAP
ncbi:MAG: TIR domain-containing protein [Verrucomicrobia bacterium]|nr:TIR domain-containing protein [Verrucomicrobiota bacterium]